MMFEDRTDAGRRLGSELAARGFGSDDMVLGIPRGGVVVAAEVARLLGASLGVAPAAKVGAPGNPEYAIGSVAADGEVSVNPASGFGPDEVREASAAAARKAAEGLARYGGEPDVRGARVIVVDDGLATGLTAMAAVDWLKRLGAAEVVLAVPVAARGSVQVLAAHADEVISLETPYDFRAVGQFYRRFDQTDDAEVARLLAPAET